MFCAHEYTQANLEFAARVEPLNQKLQNRIRLVARLRAEGDSTIPSNLATELETNPFLRSTADEVKQSALRYVHSSATGSNIDSDRHLESPSEIFAAIRAWKDNS